jgi:hypothetical protein
MPIPVKSEAIDKPADEIYASWSIEEIKQLLNEIEAELRKRPIAHAYRSRRLRWPRLMH